VLEERRSCTVCAAGPLVAEVHLPAALNTLRYLIQKFLCVVRLTACTARVTRSVSSATRGDGRVGVLSDDEASAYLPVEPH
jgi:hypothetical protein